MLKEARTRRGITLEQVEKDLKIRQRYLQAMETGRFEELPGSAYARGFLRTYGEYLGLSGDDLVEEYQIWYETTRPEEVTGESGTGVFTRAKEFRKDSGIFRLTPREEGRFKASRTKRRWLWGVLILLLAVMATYALTPQRSTEKRQEVSQPRELLPFDSQTSVPAEEVKEGKSTSSEKLQGDILKELQGDMAGEKRPPAETAGPSEGFRSPAAGQESGAIPSKQLTADRPTPSSESEQGVLLSSESDRLKALGPEKMPQSQAKPLTSEEGGTQQALEEAEGKLPLPSSSLAMVGAGKSPSSSSPEPASAAKLSSASASEPVAGEKPLSSTASEVTGEGRLSSTPPTVTGSATPGEPSSPSSSPPQETAGAKVTTTEGKAFHLPPVDAKAFPQMLTLTARFSDRCWVEVRGDGQLLEARTLEAGDSATWTATSEIKIKFGNARAAQLTLNGHDLGTAGRGVITRTFTAETVTEQE